MGQQCPRDFLESVFGYATSGELLESQTLPAFAPVEGNETADLLSSLLEQIRYERTDGAPPPIRVVVSGQPLAREILSSTLIEESMT